MHYNIHIRKVRILMRKSLLPAIFAASALLMAGCNVNVTTTPADNSSSDKATVAPAEEADPAKTDATAEAGTTSGSGSEPGLEPGDLSNYDDPKILPAFKYTGNGLYMDIISDYLVDMAREYGGGDSDVYIPFGTVIQIDDSDQSDIIAYGIYCYDGYKLLNTTLVSSSGARNYGAFHLKKGDDGKVSIASADLPEVEEESREVFAPVPGLYEKVIAFSDEKIDMLREETIASYVNTNGLNITQWQDYGHAPKPVINAPDTPEEAQHYTFTSPIGYTMTYDLRDYSLQSTEEDDMYGKVEEGFTGTLMVVKKHSGSDTEAAIEQALSGVGATDLEAADDTIGDSIPCRRAEYDEKLEDGRIFRYVCYAVPSGSDVITVLIETTVEKGVSEMSVEELKEEFKDMLASFTLN